MHWKIKETFIISFVLISILERDISTWSFILTETASSFYFGGKHGLQTRLIKFIVNYGNRQLCRCGNNALLGNGFLHSWHSLSVLKETVSSAYRRLYTFSSLSWSSSLSSSSATGADEGHAAAENILTHFTASAWRACVYFSHYFSAHSLHFFSISLTDTHWHTARSFKAQRGRCLKMWLDQPSVNQCFLFYQEKKTDADFFN